MVESVKNLSAKIDGIDVNVADKVSEKLDATIQAKVDAKVGLYEKEMMEKIAMLVEDIKNLKEKAYVNIHTDVANSNDHNSIAQEEDDDSSNALVCFLRLFLFVIFLKIMVPRNVWPTENYGWLCDSVSFSNLIMWLH